MTFQHMVQLQDFSHKGILRMPHMLSTHNILSIESNAQECVLCQHKRWLPMDHEFQSSLDIFDGVKEDKQPPRRVNVTNIITHDNTRF
jgi:hypothetical protein